MPGEKSQNQVNTSQVASPRPLYSLSPPLRAPCALAMNAVLSPWLEREFLSERNAHGDQLAAAQPANSSAGKRLQLVTVSTLQPSRLPKMY